MSRASTNVAGRNTTQGRLTALSERLTHAEFEILVPSSTVVALAEQEVKPTLTPLQQQEVDYIKSFGLVVENIGQCIEVSHQHNMPTLARCLALLENESAGRNEFGSEGPGDDGAYRWGGEVTEAGYRILRQLEADGYGDNGVGPVQLTWPGYQDEADRIGGCWRPRYSMAVGFVTLHRLIQREGSVQGGYGAYNGSGYYGAYAQEAVARAGLWEERLRGHEH